MQDITRDVLISVVGILIIIFSSMGIDAALLAVGLGTLLSEIVSMLFAIFILVSYTYLLITYSR
jgi:hypothetical protein